MWAMFVIWIVGFLTLSKIKLFHVSAVYVLSFFLFGWLRSLITGDPFLAEIAPITGPMYQLFVLFMITDPKTTVSTVKGRCVVAFLIGLVEFIFRLNEAVYAPFYALFIVGPIALIVEDWYQSKYKSSKNDTEEYKVTQ
jgi:enediyne biosynthesis protein E5